MSDGYHVEDEVQQRPVDRVLLVRLLRYVRPHWKPLLLALSLLLLTTLIDSTLPLFQKFAIDGYINTAERADLRERAEEAPGSEAAQRYAEVRERDARGLGWLVLAMGGLLVAQTLTRYGQAAIVAIVGQRTLLKMRLDVFSHLQRMSLRFLDKHPVGRLMTRVTNDVESIQQSIVADMVRIINDIFTIVIVLVFMLLLNWRLTLVCLAVIPPLFVTTFVFRRYARRSYVEIRRRIARVNAYMQESVAGIRVIQIFTAEDRAFRVFRKRNAEHRDEWFRQIRYYAIYFPVVEFLGALSVALVFYFGGREILLGRPIMGGQASIGMLFAYITWTEKLINPVKALADKYNVLQAAMASSERIFELLDTPEQLENREEAVVPERIEGQVEFDRVWFAYEAEQWVLKDVSFTIEPGESVAIVGHTGAGKSTLINLLSRFYDVQRGAIRIDGVDVRDYEKDALRRRVGIVLQDVFLFSGSIRRNIRLGDPAITDEDVEVAARHVNAWRLVERLEDGLEHDVGERGCHLSTGERQLIAFARALAHHPSILVLDEATSSVDTETEALIQDAIAKLMDERTSIVIAHRLSTVQHADRIIVMHHGEIRESGSHQDLLARRGLYHTLYELQYKDQLRPGV